MPFRAMVNLLWLLAGWMKIAYGTSNFTIGVVCPLSGAKGGTGKTFLSGLEWWQKKVNQAGGIAKKDGSRYNVELSIKDTQTNNTLAAELVTSLANGGVDAMVNCFTGHNIAINEAMKANDIKRVLMHCSGGTPAQYGDIALGVPRWPYQFGVMIPSDTYAVAFFRMVSVRVKQGLLNNTKTAIIYNRVNPFTKYTCESTVAHASNYGGVEVALNENYDGVVNDDNKEKIRGWVRQMKDMGVTILIGCTWLEDGLMLQKVIVEEKLELIANMITIAPATPAWGANFPKNASTGKSDGDYVLSPTQWHHSQRFPDSSSVGSTTDFANEFHGATNNWPNYLLSACTGAGSILEHAMGRTTWDPSDMDLSSDRLRASVRDLMVSTVYGDVRFDRHNQNVGHEPAMVQVIGSAQKSVLPESNSEDQIILPMPTWQSRDGCPAGTYNTGIACLPCPMHTFSNVFDATQCSKCPAGTDQSEKGQQSCVACSVGRFRVGDAETGCAPCAAGRYSDSEKSVFCEACPQGTYKAGTSIEGCKNCSSGTYASQPQQSECQKCGLGLYAGVASKECSFCARGKYQDKEGQASCTACGDSYPGTVSERGAQSSAECYCVDGAYYRPGVGCTECIEGLSCPQGMSPPTQKKGFYVEVVDAGTLKYDVYECINKDWCLEGAPMGCANPRVGRSCATVEGGKCPWYVPFLGLPGIFLAIYALYRATVNGIYGRISFISQCAGNLGIAVGAMQVINVYSFLYDEIPLNLNWMFAFVDIFMFRWQFIWPECNIGQAFAARLSVSIFPPITIVGSSILLFILTVCLARTPLTKLVPPMKADPTWNTAGLLIQMLYIMQCKDAFSYFASKPNPCGKETLQDFTDIVFWSDEHVSASPLLITCYLWLVYVIGTYATIMYIVFAAPRNFDKPRFWAKWRFVFARFRPECSYWGLLMLFRNLCIALVPIVVRTEDMTFRVLAFVSILAIHALAEAYFVPWFAYIHNHAEIAISMFICAIAIMGLAFNDSTSSATQSFASWVMSVFLFLIWATTLGALVSFFFMSSAASKKRQQAKHQESSKDLLEACVRIHQQVLNDEAYASKWKKFTAATSIYDRIIVESIKRLLSSFENNDPIRRKMRSSRFSVGGDFKKTDSIESKEARKQEDDSVGAKETPQAQVAGC